MEHLKLSDGEWKLMKTLWARQGQTLAELVTALDADTGWSRATIFMMLKRLIAKGAVTMDSSGKFQNTAQRSRIRMSSRRKQNRSCPRSTAAVWE